MSICNISVHTIRKHIKITFKIYTAIFQHTILKHKLNNFQSILNFLLMLMVESYTEKLKHFCNLLKHNMFSLTVMNHKTKFF